MINASFNSSSSLVEYWHVWSPENHPLIFTSELNFKTGMTVFGLCAKLFPDLVILSFELMSNHLHITVRGPKFLVMEFFKLLRSALGKAISPSPDLSAFNCSLRRLESESEVRNSITYGNRNGFLVNPDTTPFTYRWGANRYFFNPEAEDRFARESKPLSVRNVRAISHSKLFDGVNDLMMLDDYACPLSFCDIKQAESLYRNASNYFYEISRNIESHKQFAQVIGESIFYTDDELFRISCEIANERFNIQSPRSLSANQKVLMAKTLRYEYNSTKKQIRRILDIDLNSLDQLFPSIR